MPSYVNGNNSLYCKSHLNVSNAASDDVSCGCTVSEPGGARIPDVRRVNYAVLAESSRLLFSDASRRRPSYHRTYSCFLYKHWSENTSKQHNAVLRCCQSLLAGHACFIIYIKNVDSNLKNFIDKEHTINELSTASCIYSVSGKKETKRFL